MRFYEEQRFAGGWRWFWAGLVLGPVVIALLALGVARIPLVISLGYASSVAVASAVLAAITLLPALLALVGRRIDAVRLPAFLRDEQKPPEAGLWPAWARLVTGHPWLTVLGVCLLIAPLAVPTLSLRLGLVTPDQE